MFAPEEPAFRIVAPIVRLPMLLMPPLEAAELPLRVLFLIVAVPPM